MDGIGVSSYAIRTPIDGRRRRTAPAAADGAREQGRSVPQTALDIVRKRDAPAIYIVDGEFHVVLTRPVEAGDVAARLTIAEDGRLPQQVENIIRMLVQERDDREPAIALLTPRTLLRVVPLSGSAGQHHAVILERYEARVGLATAADRFRLTPREMDVLHQLVNGASTGEIALALHIAETTVQDHVKRISGKMNVRKRTEIVARALGSN